MYQLRISVENIYLLEGDGSMDRTVPPQSEKPRACWSSHRYQRLHHIFSSIHLLLILLLLWSGILLAFFYHWTDSRNKTSEDPPPTEPKKSFNPTEQLWAKAVGSQSECEGFVYRLHHPNIWKNLMLCGFQQSHFTLRYTDHIKRIILVMNYQWQEKNGTNPSYRWCIPKILYF